MLAVDLETREGNRRFFSIDTVKSSCSYFDVFKTRPLPVAVNIDTETALHVFDTVWSAFDREYAMFAAKPEVDWSHLRVEFRARVPAAKTNLKLAELLAEMLGHLKDLHAGVRIGDFNFPVYERVRPLNANRLAVPKLLGAVTVVGRDLSWCITDDGVGYMAIDRLTDLRLPQFFSEALEKMNQTRGLILDLRYNGGGSEPLGLEIAGSFLDRERVYAQSQYRNGPRHTDLDTPKSRVCRPKDPWHYVAPVIVLQGQRTMSSAEALVLMLSQGPEVTTMGDRTAGSSGNPRSLDAGAGITVNLPRWNDLDAEGKPFDAIGIPPDIAINTTTAGFSDQDDIVLAAALERLRAGKKFEGIALRLRPGARHPNERPRVVAVSPAHDAVGIDPVTEIRIRFDRPMDPESFYLQWRPAGATAKLEVGFRLRDAIRYLPERHEFVFPVRLTPEAEHRIEMVADDPLHASPMHGFFRSAAGAGAMAYEWHFRTHTARPDERATRVIDGNSDPKPDSNISKFATEHERAAQVTEAERSASLRALVGKVRQRRRVLKSVVVRVDDRTC